MTITRHEKPIPDTLPISRLFLDDLNEIIDVVAEATKGSEEQLVLKCRVAGATCDQIEELPKIAKSARKFQIDLEKRHYHFMLKLTRFGARYSAYGFTNDEKWRLFRKIEAIFEARRLPFRNLIKVVLLDTPWWISLLFGATAYFGIPFLGGHVYSLFPKVLANALLLTSIVALVAMIWYFLRGSEIVFRDSQDYEAQREDRAWKIIPAVLSGVIGFLAGIAVTYLKHAYWP